MTSKRSERIWQWTVTTLLTGAFVSLIALGTARFLGRSPYGGEVTGTAVSKNIVSYQGKRTRMAHFIDVRTADGSVERVAVTPELYRKVSPGWQIERHGRTVTATSPEGKVSTAVLP